MYSRSPWIVGLLLLLAVVPSAALAQYGGALHSGGWANGAGALVPPRAAAAPVALVLLAQTSYTAGGSNAFAYLYFNAPMSEARARIRVVRISDSVVISTSGWTTALSNHLTVSGLTYGTTYRVEVDLQALTPAWASVPWATMIASYVQPGKYDPPFEWERES